MDGMLQNAVSEIPLDSVERKSQKGKSSIIKKYITNCYCRKSNTNREYKNGHAVYMANGACCLFCFLCHSSIFSWSHH